MQTPNTKHRHTFGIGESRKPTRMHGVPFIGSTLGEFDLSILQRRQYLRVPVVQQTRPNQITSTISDTLLQT
jgi:hypothetical protein